MANSLNKVMLIGRTGKDPELRYTAGGTAISKFTVATSENWGKGENRKENTEWHRIVCWGKLAEITGEYVKKGKQLYIEGRIQTNQWEDKDGNKRYTTEIIANSVILLGSKKDDNSGYGGSNSYENASLDKFVDNMPKNQEPVSDEWDDDEVPF